MIPIWAYLVMRIKYVCFDVNRAGLINRLECACMDQNVSYTISESPLLNEKTELLLEIDPLEIMRLKLATVDMRFKWFKHNLLIFSDSMGILTEVLDD